MKFYLNNTFINDEPDGDILTTIKRDSQLGGFLITNDAKLKWHGDGFDLIQGVIDTSGFCAEIACEIWDNCDGQDIRIFIGKIFILEIEKDSNCIITAPVQDNNFYARINKNKSIEITVDTTRSKNGETIDAAAENTITMFKPDSVGPTAITDPRTGYRVYDVFKNMIAFMSDDEVAFDSNLFGLGGEFEGLSVMYGQEIAFFGTGGAIKASFDKFFQEVKKKINVTFYIDTTGNVPVLRIEKYQDLFLNTIVRKLENVNGVKFKIDTSKLVAIISVGSDKILDALPGNGVSFVESNLYFTYKPENYTTLEQCNIDARLDLMSSYVISSNMIEDLLIQPTTNFAEEIFFVDCEDVTVSGSGYTSTAIPGNPFASAPPYFYNTRLMNNEVLERWNSQIPNSIVNFTGTVNNLFRAAHTANINIIAISYTTYFPFQFDDDFNFPNFDGNGVVNNYGNGTAQGTPVSQANSRYTCVAEGTHTFYHQFQILASSSYATISHGFQRYNSGTIFQEASGVLDIVNNTTTVPQTTIITHQASFYCLAGDYISCDVTIDAVIGLGSAYIVVLGANNETYFACTSAPDSGGEVITLNNQNEIPIVKADFEYPIPNADFYAIEDNVFQKIAITYNGNKVQAGWIDTLKYNHNTSMANVTLLGTQEMLK